MEKNILQAILETYCEKYDEFNVVSNEPYEAFKWIATKHFQKHWDSSVEDAQYAAMFEEAFAKTADLIDSSTFPVATTIKALKDITYVPAVRKAFDLLFADDKGDLENRLFRIKTFIQNMNEINQKSQGKINDWHLNYDLRAALACLNLYAPKDNYFYKATEFKAFCKMIETEGVGSGDNFNLEAYYSFCDELLTEIVKYKPIMDITAATLAKDNSAVDDNNHILVYDVINNLKYFEDALALYFDKKMAAAKAEGVELISTKKANKSLVGLELETKNHGIGIIVSEEADKVVVQFPSVAGNKSYAKNSIGKVIFIKDEEYLAIQQENDNITVAVKRIEAKIRELYLLKAKVTANLTKLAEK